MAKLFIKYFFITILFFLSTSVFAQNDTKTVNVVFGSKTSGSIELLGKKASAILKIGKDNSIIIDLGSLLGPTKIINYDEGALFLNSAREAGIEYMIPSASEFMFGKDVFRSFAASGIVPDFVSSNIIDERTRKTLTKNLIIKNFSGLTICLIPISDIRILKEANDVNVTGVDILYASEAISDIKEDILSKHPDIVIAAGRMDRETINILTSKFDFIDIFITNNPSGGFSDQTSSTNSLIIDGKPVFVGSEKGDRLGLVKINFKSGIEQTEYSEILLDDRFPPDAAIVKKLNETMSVMTKKDSEETIVLKTGGAVGKILKKVFDVDAVFLEKQSLYYYSLADSIGVLNVREIIKPEQELVSFNMKGKQLKSIWEQSGSQAFADLRLIITGMTEDGRLDSIPLQDDRDYWILTTKFLRMGGNGYEQFKESENETLSGIDMLETVESTVVAKERRIRELSKPKIWELNLFLTLNSNFNRTDVDADKSIYGSKIPKPFFDMQDRYEGNFIINSLNNLLTMKKNYKKKYF